MLRRPLESTLATRVRMADELVQARVSSRPGGHVECVKDEVGRHRPTGLPAHDATAEHVGDEGDVDDAGPRRAVGEVADPELVRSSRAEVALDEVGAAHVAQVRMGREALLRPRGAADPQAIHEPGHLLAPDVEVLASRRPPELALAVDGVVGLPQAEELRTELLITDLASRGWTGLSGVVGGGGDLENLADRLDPPSTPTGLSVPVGVDEGDYLFGRRSKRPRRNWPRPARCRSLAEALGSPCVTSRVPRVRPSSVRVASHHPRRPVSPTCEGTPCPPRVGVSPVR